MKHVGNARTTLGSDADTVWAEGRATLFDDAVDIALDRNDKQARIGG